MHSKTLQSSDGAALRYYSFGAGAEPLVFVSPPGMSVRFWLPLIERLRPRYRVLAFEYRGFPAAEPSPPSATFEQCVADLATLLRAETIGGAHFVAWCGGASLVAALQARQPRALISLFTVGVAAGDSNEPSQFVATMSEIKQMVDDDPASLGRVIVRMQRLGLCPGAEHFERIHRAGDDGESAADAPVVDELAALPYLLFDSESGLVRYLQLFQEFIVNDRPIGPMGCPVTLVHAKASTRPVVDGELRDVIIEHESPFVMLERPRALERELVEHLARTTRTSKSSVIEGLPRIDRYFPECWCATIEAVASLRFGTADFGKLYGRHSFVYKKKPGAIQFKPNGVDLDLELYREVVPVPELPGLIESIYRIRVEERRLDTLEAYWSTCLDHLRQGVPVVIDFDLRFIAARREYGKVDSPHVIAIYGYDAAERNVLAAEQMLGTTVISWADFQACVAHKLAREGSMRYWEVTRLPGTERDLTREELVTRIESNLANLSSTDEQRGLGALRRFREDLTAYLGGPDFMNRPFSIPGLWVFSHERHIERKWLNAASPFCPPDSALLRDFDQLLAQLFQGWLNTDYLIEKCLAAENGKPLKHLPAYLLELEAGEKKAHEMWCRVHDALLRA
jgi:pimeloyl-ACP methyl ester carboxylesterase